LKIPTGTSSRWSRPVMVDFTRRLLVWLASYSATLYVSTLPLNFYEYSGLILDSLRIASSDRTLLDPFRHPPGTESTEIFSHASCTG
jgi:hypothetical protein